MNKVFIEKFDAICSAGESVKAIDLFLSNNKTSLTSHTFKFNESVEYPIGWFKANHINNLDRYDEIFFEKICLLLLERAEVDLKDNKTLLIISTTKGNIQLSEKNISNSLFQIIDNLKQLTQAKNDPIIISNACISGVAALITAHDFVKQDIYDKVVVLAADFISKFVVSGFHSFQALSNQVCKPYDAERNGLNLGEAAAIAVVSKKESGVEILGGATSNDANHISGPHRNGEGLINAVTKTLALASNPKIDAINAHGTATIYNDEMESQAFHQLNMAHIPLNSLKGYFGHTLGASGLLESVLCCQMINNQMLYGSLGFAKNGLSHNLNVAQKQKLNISHLLKTASGFGGTNAALILKNNG